MKTSTCKIKSIPLLILIISLLPTVAFAGLGNSPSEITYTTLVPGSTIKQTVSISSSSNEVDTKFTASIIGTAAQFVTLDTGATYLLEKDATTIAIPITISIPTDTKYGTYTGQIKITSPAFEQNIPTNMDLSQNMVIDLNIPVSLEVQKNEITDYTITDITTFIITPADPIYVQYNILNNGNTAVEQPQIEVSVKKLKTTQEQIEERKENSSENEIDVAGEEVFTDSIQNKYPRTIGFAYESHYVIFEHDIEEPGIYWLDVTFKDFKGEVLAKRRLALEVVKNFENTFIDVKNSINNIKIDPKNSAIKDNQINNPMVNNVQNSKRSKDIMQVIFLILVTLVVLIMVIIKIKQQSNHSSTKKKPPHSY